MFANRSLACSLTFKISDLFRESVSEYLEPSSPLRLIRSVYMGGLASMQYWCTNMEAVDIATYGRGALAGIGGFNQGLACVSFYSFW